MWSFATYGKIAKFVSDSEHSAEEIIQHLPHLTNLSRIKASLTVFDVVQDFKLPNAKYKGREVRKHCIRVDPKKGPLISELPGQFIISTPKPQSTNSCMRMTNTPFMEFMECHIHDLRRT